MTKRARLIAIEGLDGSGKGTQLERLAADLRASGFRVATAAFPAYDRGIIGAKVGEYLDGRLGRVPDDRPWLPALLFATDRYEQRRGLLDQLGAADYLLVDRYVASNVAFQGIRLERPALAEFAVWLDQLEFGVFALPRPDLQLYLRMPPATARRLVLRKAKRTYTDRGLDVYEEDAARQARSGEIYEWLAETGFGGPWQIVEGADDQGEPRSREEVTADLLAAVDATAKPLPDAS